MDSTTPDADKSDDTDDADDTTAAEPDTSGEKGADEQFCSSCGEVIKKEAELCPECGVKQSKESDNSPGIAALLSGVGLLFPIAAGAGQIYNGEVGKGVAFSLIQLINVGLFFLVIGFITYPIVGLYAVYDAYQNA